MPPDRPAVLLARHGETAWNAEGRIQGRHDVPLSETGVAQAAALARRMRGAPPARVVSSDLARARATAEAVAAAIGAAVILDPHLREQSLGEWETRTFAEVERDDPERAARFRARDPDLRPPGGETRRELQVRSLAALEAHAAAGSPGPLLVVTHGGVIQSLLYAVLGLPLSAPRRFLVPNAGLTTLVSRRDAWFVATLGDVSHLPATPGESFPFD